MPYATCKSHYQDFSSKTKGTKQPFDYVFDESPAFPKSCILVLFRNPYLYKGYYSYYDNPFYKPYHYGDDGDCSYFC